MLGGFANGSRTVTLGGLARQSDLLLVALIVAVIALMVLPLPPFMLDTLIATNLTVSVVLLMVVLYISSPLGLSTFPTLLLFTTLFRLSLNIASTRQILLHAYAGEIINTFGRLVVGNDIIVGGVVFLIIAIVQFVVIAKGAERVAEVGARFTLDAMPGKQMSIDADLRAGIIDKELAKRRRSELERESQLYGAMDGAMKFVKGDAIAGLLIAAVNIIAGVTIGMVHEGMDMDTALHTYSVLSVGDALVSQIPSLFVSITAGIVITRVSDPDGAEGANLGNEIAQQIRAQPKALLIGGIVVLGLMLVPGFPKLQFVGLGLIVGTLGYSLMPGHRRYAVPGETPVPAMRREGSDRISTFLDPADYPMTVPLVVQAFAAVEQVLQPRLLESELTKIRRHLALDLGIPFPGVVMRSSARLPTGHCTVYVQEIPVQSIELKPEHVLALESAEDLAKAGITYETGEIAMFARPALWVPKSLRTKLDREKSSYFTLEQVLARSVLHAMQGYADEFLGIQEVQLLLRRLAEEYPELERELQRNVPLPRLTEVLKRLVRENISIRNLRNIAHALIEWAPKEKDTVLVTEYVRTTLSRYISYRFTADDSSMPAAILHPQVEEQIQDSIRQTSAGAVLMLDPEISAQLVEKAKEAFASPQESQSARAILTTLEIRPYIRKLLETDLAHIPILSYQELEPNINVVPVSSISLDAEI